MASRPRGVIVSRIKRWGGRTEVPEETSDQPAVKEAEISYALCCRTKRDASAEICCCSHFPLSSQSFFFLFMAGGNKPGPFCWGRLASPGHSSLFCFKRARRSSLSSLPCSPTPGAMLASAASSPGDWANVSWLHLAVFLWYGHITSAWAHVTLHLFLTLSSLLPSMFFLLLSPPPFWVMLWFAAIFPGSAAATRLCRVTGPITRSLDLASFPLQETRRARPPPPHFFFFFFSHPYPRIWISR